ncbi:MAG TPA: SGNH/GDSL hydrolase family protein [Actinophytocola sp.]|uniref:SGNH/GDSL hydrolase family protein n=1 Tax=Actinophytocola sp. TaxID=1872138 RepID=UPI002DDCB410|nr:SGNH/GDSL hydrolase family protein [Actinophytocola sp.]HEV2779726.1 SGNH/GDSL hydrolase family protein [Actinophytocola sp.]
MFALAAILGLLLSGAPPAVGSVPDGDLTSPEELAHGPWNPQPKIPEFTLPGTGEKIRPFSTMEPTAPKALPGFENVAGAPLKPAGRPIRRAEQVRPQGDVPPPEEPWICHVFLTKIPTLRQQTTPPTSPPPNVTQFAQIYFSAELICNFYFDFAIGTVALVDRSVGFDGRTLATGNTPIQSFGNYHGFTEGALEIPGELYDGGRQLEVVFDVIIGSPGIWGGCAPASGQRLLRCDGVGTSTLHAVLGTDVFPSGLNRAVIRYVALGDSFAAGAGAPPYDRNGSTNCKRSSASYPYRMEGLVAPGVTGLPAIDEPVFRACDGAKIDDMNFTQFDNNPEPGGQLAFLNRQSTRLVTVSIGGNDLGFADKLLDCFSNNCDRGEPLIRQVDLDINQSRLRSVYLNIRAKMRPDGYLVVVNYPSFLPRPREGEPFGCGDLFGFSEGELNRIDEAVQAARTMVANAVAAAGNSRIRLVDMYDAFAGHKPCSPDPWANGEDFPIGQSFHPNARGYDVYTTRIRQALGLI